MQSIAMQLFLESFKSAAAEGAVLELKLRLLAASVPALEKYALDQQLQEIETELVKYFDGSLAPEEKDILRLCRQLRNKVLHADFQAARVKLNELGLETASGQVRGVDVRVISVAELSKKIGGLKSGTQGINIADTTSTASGTIYGWFFDAGSAGDFEKAANAFKDAAKIVERLADGSRRG